MGKSDAERIVRGIVFVIACLIILAYAATFAGLALGWIGDPPPIHWR